MKEIQIMNSVNLNEWWASLTITQKERIANKGIEKYEDFEYSAVYPYCTDWWNQLSLSIKIEIHDHCVDAHGLLRPEWKEGKMMSE